MTDKNKLLLSFFNEYEKAEKRKTKKCLSEEIMWDYLQDKIDIKLRKNIEKHIINCPFCLRLRSDINLYINPPGIEIPGELSEGIDKSIRESILNNRRIMISLSYIKEKSKTKIDKIQQIYTDVIREIPFKMIPSIVQDVNGSGIKAEYTKFETDEIRTTIYQSKNEITLILEKLKESTNKKDIDQFKVVLLAKDNKTLIKKPYDGIVKISRFPKNDFLIIIE